MEAVEIVASEQVTEKRCSKCKKVKLLEDFHRHKHGKHGRRARCRACCYEQEKELRKGLSLEELYKRTGYTGEKARDWYLKRTYNIDSKIYDEMFQAQNGVCAICKKPETGANQFGKLSLAVDHDHVTGKVRGLLCQTCNRKLVEDIDWFLSAQSYLERYRS